MPRLNVFSGSEDKKKEEDGGSSWFPKIEIQIPMFSGDEDRKSSDEENQIMKGAGENLLFGLPPFVVLFRATHNAHINLLCLVLCDLGPAHTTPRGVGLMAWAIRRSVFSSHA